VHRRRHGRCRHLRTPLMKFRRRLCTDVRGESARFIEIVDRVAPSFRAQSADAFSFRFAPANRSADAERNPTSVFTPGNVSTLLLAIFFFAFALNAQAPTAVPVAQEPHHHKVFENSYVRVLRVSIPANESTLLHQHDASYVYVSLGPADIINAVQGKPEIHPKLVDGQVGYAKGGFAHVATAVGIPFNNVTVELLHPQGDAKNLCDKVVDGPIIDCSPNINKLPSDSSLRSLPKLGIIPRPVFETDEIEVASYSLSFVGDHHEDSRSPRLLVAEDGPSVHVEIAGESGKYLNSGETAWIEAGKEWKVVLPRQNKPTRFLRIRFKDADATAKP
jgi:hypothetical protein